jgi:hypothetical protein
MAEYKYPGFLKQITDKVFDGAHGPGSPTPLSGIYRCIKCGHEAVSTNGHPLPPQNHHQHHPPAPIAWQLIVASTHA